MQNGSGSDCKSRINSHFKDRMEKNMYRVEGYDKDNGVYVEYWKGEDLEKAKDIATILDNIAIKDELIRYTSFGKFGLEK